MDSSFLGGQPDNFRSLLKSCAQVWEELKVWVRIPRIKERLATTVRWGLIDPEVTTCLIDIDGSYRHFDDNYATTWYQNWKILQQSADAEFVQTVLLRFRTQDVLTSPDARELSNSRAVRRVWGLPNLRTLDIHVKDFGLNWGWKEEEFREIVKDSKDMYVIPIGDTSAVCMEEYLERHWSPKGPVLPRLVLRLWSYGSPEISPDAKELFASYNSKVNEVGEESTRKEGGETADTHETKRVRNFLAK
jgi:hypothetical protein